MTANGENVAGGMGLTPSTADAILAAGVDVITSGNHIWDKREIYPVPRTRPTASCGRTTTARTTSRVAAGACTTPSTASHVAVINLQGRTYMQPIENPFTDADALLDEASSPEPLPPIRLVDFHCELTSEKNALGLYLDGRVSVVVGTHTHVVTGDERILPGGTAYQTDLGMTGPVWSVIGFDPTTVLPRFINALPTRFEVGQRAGRLQRRPDRHRSGHRAGRSRSSGSSASSRREPVASVTSRAATTRLPPDGGRSSRPARRRSTCTRTRRAPTASSPPARARRGGRSRPASGVSALTDHDTLAGYRDVVAADAVPAGLTLIPGVEINALVTRDLGLWEGELHILGFGMDPGGRGVRGGAGRAARPAPACASSGPSTGCARSGCRSMPRSPRSTLGDDDALGRPTIARALIAAGLRRRASRTRSAGSSGTGRRATSPRRGSDRRRRSASSRPPAASRSWPTSARRRRASSSLRELVEVGLAGLEVYYRTFDAGDGRRGRRRSRAELGLLATGGTRLPRRPRPVCRGARRAVGPARGRRAAPRPRLAALTPAADAVRSQPAGRARLVLHERRAQLDRGAGACGGRRRLSASTKTLKPIAA